MDSFNINLKNIDKAGIGGPGFLNKAGGPAEISGANNTGIAERISMLNQTISRAITDVLVLGPQREEQSSPVFDQDSMPGGISGNPMLNAFISGMPSFGAATAMPFMTLLPYMYLNPETLQSQPQPAEQKQPAGFIPLTGPEPEKPGAVIPTSTENLNTSSTESTTGVDFMSVLSKGASLSLGVPFLSSIGKLAGLGTTLGQFFSSNEVSNEQKFSLFNKAMEESRQKNQAAGNRRVRPGEELENMTRGITELKAMAEDQGGQYMGLKVKDLSDLETLLVESQGNMKESRSIREEFRAQKTAELRAQGKTDEEIEEHMKGFRGRQLDPEEINDPALRERHMESRTRQIRNFVGINEVLNRETEAPHFWSGKSTVKDSLQMIVDEDMEKNAIKMVATVPEDQAAENVEGIRSLTAGAREAMGEEAVGETESNLDTYSDMSNFMEKKIAGEFNEILKKDPELIKTLEAKMGKIDMDKLDLDFLDTALTKLKEEALLKEEAGGDMHGLTSKDFDSLLGFVKSGKDLKELEAKLKEEDNTEGLEKLEQEKLNLMVGVDDFLNQEREVDGETVTLKDCLSEYIKDSEAITEEEKQQLVEQGQEFIEQAQTAREVLEIHSKMDEHKQQVSESGEKVSEVVESYNQVFSQAVDEGKNIDQTKLSALEDKVFEMAVLLAEIFEENRTNPLYDAVPYDNMLFAMSSQIDDLKRQQVVNAQREKTQSTLNNLGKDVGEDDLKENRIDYTIERLKTEKKEKVEKFNRVSGLETEDPQAKIEKEKIKKNAGLDTDLQFDEEKTRESIAIKRLEQLGKEIRK